ncbi:MAG: hypothetical protein WBC60_02210 [Cognaticolwellia sp.]
MTQKIITKLLRNALFTFILLLYISNSFVQAKEYIIGVEDVSYYPIYNFSLKSLNQASFTKELLSTFFHLKNYQFKFVALPVKRFDKWYVEEAIDFKFPDSIRWRGEESKKLNITYSKPVLHLTAGSFVLKKDQNKTAENIKRLGIIFGFYPTLWNDRVRVNTLDIVEASSPYSLVKHLLHGNVDAIYIDKNVIAYNLKRLHQDDDTIVLNQNIKHERYAFHFSSVSHPEIIQEFDEFLLSHQSLVAKMKKKYGIIETLDTF